MERCSFCIQRIRRGELQVERQEGGKLEYPAMKERNFLPACVQACPTNALQFGDQGDDKGPVKNFFDDLDGHDDGHGAEHKTRGYRLLEEIGTKPNVIYLKKVDKYPLKNGTHA